MNVIKRPQLTGTPALLPGLPLVSNAPLTLTAAHAAPALAQPDAPVTIGSAFKQVASERARRLMTRDAPLALAGADVALSVRHLRSTGGAASINDIVHIEQNPLVTVWAKENRVRSKDKTTTVTLPGKVRLSADGIETMIVHVSGKKPIASIQNNEPFAGGAKVPTDAFVQSQVTETLVAYLNKIASYGLNLRSVYRDHDHNDGVIRVFVNAEDVLNAAYVPSRNYYFFGNYHNRIPLGADQDVTIHECSHGLLDHIAPGLNSDDGEGGAFHEAFGDIMATLMFHNAGMSEDLGSYMAAHSKKADPSLRRGLRRVDNDAVLDPKVTEVHDRSLAYSGLMWKTKQALAKVIGDDVKACELMQAAYIKAAFFMTKAGPSSSDIVSALADGIRSYFAHTAPKHAASTVRALLAEAKKRGMLEQPLSKHDDIAPFRAKSAGDIVAMLKALPAIKARKDVSFEAHRDIEFGNVRRVTIRPVITDPHSGTKLPVDDSHLVVVIEDGKTKIIDDSAFVIPTHVSFGHGVPSLAHGVKTAQAIIRKELKKEAAKDESAAKMLESFETLFDDENIKAEWVISHGVVCVSIQTLAGDFIIDVKNGDIFDRDVMRVDSGEHRLADHGSAILA